VRHEVGPLPDWLIARETLRLQTQLQAAGGALTTEQRQAIELGCGTRQVVVIEGQGGTGKSTVLAAIARAHQADGRTILVTSTAGLAAQRLTREFASADVTASSYSTAALARTVRTGQLTLGPSTTVIHDEAALASTTELHQLLTAVEASGARLIMVGDHRQSLPVGAGGIWPHL
jgi:ATP-dependent exoDNAse (exonuclease V) alpha subunit